MSSIALWLAVGVIGGTGSIARLVLHELVALRARRRFPLGTLAVNVGGCVLLGLLVGLGVHGDAYLLAATALLGSFTTFSTWIFDSHQLAGEGLTRAAILNVALSLLLGVGAVALGRLLGGG